MKQLIFILLAMIGVSQAQTIQYIGAPTTTVISRGNFRTDSIFYLPKRTKLPTDTAALRYQISDSSMYAWTGSQWRKVGADPDSLIFSTRAWRQKGDDSLAALINLKVNISDTATMLGNYIRHAGYGLTKSGQSFLVDTLNIATRAWRQKGLDSLAALEISGSGTINRVPKFTASGSIGNGSISDSSTSVRMTIQSNGRIGINTTTDAGYQFDVAGSMRNTTGANFATTSGNIGVGTESPGYKLDIRGTARSLNEMRVTSSLYLSSYNTSLRSDAGANGILQLGNNNINYILAGNTLAGGFLAIRVNVSDETLTSGSEALRITSSGEVLINTQSDAGDYKLQVNGNSLFSGNIRTAAPAGGTANDWRLGTVATVTPTSPNRTIEVSIGGTIYYIHAKTTND